MKAADYLVGQETCGACRRTSLVIATGDGDRVAPDECGACGATASRVAVFYPVTIDPNLEALMAFEDELHRLEQAPAPRAH